MSIFLLTADSVASHLMLCSDAFSAMTNYVPHMVSQTKTWSQKEGEKEGEMGEGKRKGKTTNSKEKLQIELY